MSGIASTATARTARRSPGRRALAFLLKATIVVVLVWLVFQLFGLRVVRVSRSGVSLRQADTAAVLRSDAIPKSDSATDTPRNLILFVADGLGFAHLSVGRATRQGINGPAIWDRFTATGWQRPHPAIGFLTDSAAAATALATGHPAAYGTIGVDVEGQPLETLFERAATLGYRTGIVTDSYVWDATPAAFVVHSPRRDNENAESALRQLGDSALEVLAGELEDVGEGEVPEWDASVDLLNDRFDVLGPQPSSALLDKLETGWSPTAAIFEEDQVTDLDSSPNLPALVAAALRRLSSDDRPFLLLVESEEPDSASHSADLGRLLRGMRSIEATLEILLDFAADDGETLLVFTGDHETGGLALSIAGERNSELQAIWPTSGHTGSAVPVLAFGPAADEFGGMRANWELGRLLGRMLRQPDGAPAG